MRRAGLIDFDDMMVLCLELFTERKDILSAWQRRYRYILIDEFQDINRLQYEIVRMLAKPEDNLLSWAMMISRFTGFVGPNRRLCWGLSGIIRVPDGFFWM